MAEMETFWKKHDQRCMYVYTGAQTGHRKEGRQYLLHFLDLFHQPRNRKKTVEIQEPTPFPVCLK